MTRGLSRILIPFLILSCIVFATFSIRGEEEKIYYVGTNSNQSGCVTQLNNQGAQNYLKFVSVAPIVNRIMIVNQDNGAVFYDGKPEAGATVYVPKGRYAITGWSAYGTDDANAVTISFQNTPATPAAKATASEQITVDGTPVQSSQDQTIIYDSGIYGGYSYPYYYYGTSPRPTPYPYMWCTACGQYHKPGGCIFTKKTNSILDPYNPYWRGGR